MCNTSPVETATGNAASSVTVPSVTEETIPNSVPSDFTILSPCAIMESASTQVITIKF
jgi:hypothetical protein